MANYAFFSKPEVQLSVLLLLLELLVVVFRIVRLLITVPLLLSVSSRSIFETPPAEFYVPMTCYGECNLTLFKAQLLGYALVLICVNYDAIRTAARALVGFDMEVRLQNILRSSYAPAHTPSLY